MKFKSYCTLLILAGILFTPFAYTEEKEPAEINEPLIHVIMSNRIQSIMLKLNMLVNERGLTALQIMEKRVQHLKALIDTIDELIIAAETLTDAIPGVRISPENQITFEALAMQLKYEAGSLKEEAEETNYAGMEPAYQRLNQTCDACHQLFRF